jgi:hypothetical protein
MPVLWHLASRSGCYAGVGMTEMRENLPIEQHSSDGFHSQGVAHRGTLQKAGEISLALRLGKIQSGRDGSALGWSGALNAWTPEFQACPTSGGSSAAGSGRMSSGRGRERVGIYGT